MRIAAKTYQFFRQTIILGCQTLNFVLVLFSLLQNFRWRVLPPHPSSDWRWDLGHFSGRRSILLLSRGSSHDTEQLLCLCVLFSQSRTRFDATFWSIPLFVSRGFESSIVLVFGSISRSSEAILGLQDTLVSTSLDKMMSSPERCRLLQFRG